MKKFLTLIAALFCFTFANAAITNLEVDVQGTNADFYWQGDTTVSKVYEIDLLEGSEFGYIAAGAWNSSVFDMGYQGWMWMSSDLLLTYGNNYVDLKNAGVADNVVEAWKTNWEASVDTVSGEVTLKPGEYVVVIEGYDANYDNKTETMVYEFFEIVEDVPTDANELVNTNNKSRKFINPKGEVIIYNNGNFFDLFGRKVN